MAEVRPFRGIRFTAKATTNNPDGLICPPYDIIGAELHRKLLAGNPHNAIRLELPEGSPDETASPNRYTQARDTFAHWLNEGALARDSMPAYYLLRHTFQHEGKSYQRLALLSAVRLEEFEKGVVLPHEHTTPAPKRDRLALMRACRANFSPLMVLYRDTSGRVDELLKAAMSRKPIFAAKDSDGYPCEMWLLDKTNVISQIQEAMSDWQLYIADGHHRYETALAYRNEIRSSLGCRATGREAFNYVLLALISFDDPGLVVLPYHRVLSSLSKAMLDRVWTQAKRLFEVTKLDLNPSSLPGTLMERVEKAAASRPAVGVVAADGTVNLLTFRADADMTSLGELAAFEAWLLQEKVLRPALGDALAEHITYVHSDHEALHRVRGGEAQLGLFTRAVPMNLFESVVSRGIRLPPKSTYFYPKLPTGLVFNSLEGEL